MLRITRRSWLCSFRQLCPKPACEGVVGVLFASGVAQGYADHFSELDLAVYLVQPRFED